MNHFDWNEIVRELGPRLYRYFCARFSKEQADDLTQESLVRLVRKVHEQKFDPTLGNLSMLAFGIAHYVALESRKFEARNLAEEWRDEVSCDVHADIDLEKIFFQRDLNRKVREQFQFLSDLEQQVISLLIDDELKLQEIAQILRMPESTVKSHVFRAKKKLKYLLQKEGVS